MATSSERIVSWSSARSNRVYRPEPLDLYPSFFRELRLALANSPNRRWLRGTLQENPESRVGKSV